MFPQPYIRTLKIYIRSIYIRTAYLITTIKLNGVITYSSGNAFYRRENSITPSQEMKGVWNTLKNDTSSLSYDVVKKLCIESTDWFEERLTYVQLMDDYGNERLFREDNYSISADNNDNDNDYHVIGYEIT